MYITTFYSFKGGVGRSMALVNSAIALASGGRKVLVVDFDIEAPGLDTFDLLKTSSEKPGLVDFVTTYLESGRSPNVEDYVSECPSVEENSGKLWLMRSGYTKTYATSFQRIDWSSLYELHDGFLLFEDLKEQWREIFNPDYVLIDSRTGYTDSSGICTRQLPDSVVILFFPNEQNLRGLTEVVTDIRAEGNSPRGKKIDLHFVMSNVPDLDDEDRILEGKIAAFRRQLGLKKDPMIVHRYDSLSLLNQTVFIKERPKSRLSKEYSEIVKEVSVRNPKDRDGAIEYIRRTNRYGRWQPELTLIEQSEMLDSIEKHHFEDGEVLFELSELKYWLDDNESAEALLLRAVELGHNTPETFLRHSAILEKNNDSEGARAAASKVLELKSISARLTRSAISRILRVQGSHNLDMVDMPAVSTLSTSEKLWIANSLENLNAAITFRVSLYEQLFEHKELSDIQRTDLRLSLGLLYISLTRFKDAVKLFCPKIKTLQEFSISNAFNYAMAKWGESEDPPVKDFKNVLKMDFDVSEKKRTANYLQCMALAYKVTSDCPAALDSLEKARDSAKTSRNPSEFSCWRYRQVSKKNFIKDLDEMKIWIEANESDLQISKIPVFHHKEQMP